MSDHELIADLPDDGSRQQEVYARFGLAVYFAQVFEHGLVNVLVLSDRLAGRIVDEAAWDERFDRLFTKTASDLLRRLRATGLLSPDDATLCHDAILARNRLVHHFFRVHTEDFMTTSGQQRMVDDADSIRDLLQRADAITERITVGTLQSVGVDPAIIDLEAERLRQAALERDSE